MEDDRRQIKIGIIGCGQAALRGHLPALRHVSGAKAIAAADLDDHRLQRAADRFNIPRRYTNDSQLRSGCLRERRLRPKHVRQFLALVRGRNIFASQ
jgi:predicted homoserine dehydrogenase-like protein